MMKFEDRIILNGSIFNAKNNGECMKEIAHRHGISLWSAYRHYHEHETNLRLLGIPVQKNVKHPELTM